jgi:Protein of unknown function (DUF4230)
MQKRLTRFVLLIVLILSGLFLLQRIQFLPSFSDIFKSQPLQIENSAILIEEINNLAQLITLSAYNEITIDSTKKVLTVFNNPLVPGLMNIPDILQPDPKIILIGKGTILAGVNLAKITAANVFVQKDSVSLMLPKVEIFQIILNPSGFEVFEESGNWTDEEVKAVKIKLRHKLVVKALQQNILQKASARAILIMESFLRAAGFKKVNVTMHT